MKVLKAYKTELKPNKAQIVLLKKACGVARFAYNWGLGRRIEEYKNTGRISTAIEQHKQLNVLKDSKFPWMRESSKCAPQEALRDLDNAYKRFIKSRKYGGKHRFPKFKSKRGVSPSFRISSSHIGKISKTHIWIAKIGSVRIKENGYIPMDSKTISITVKCSGGCRWFVSVKVEEDSPVYGVDLGLKSFAVFSNGEIIDSPKFLLKKERKLKRLQRRVSSKNKGGSNRRKAVNKLAIQHFKIANSRKDFIHKISSRLAKTKPVIVVEDLNVSGMLKNHKLAKGISDAGWSEFRRQLKYKCEWYGSTLIVADRFFASSKTCSRCGEKKAVLSRGERTYRCEFCGFVCDRDLNAALNLKKYGEEKLKQNTVSSTEINACGESHVVECLSEAGNDEVS